MKFRTCILLGLFVLASVLLFVVTFGRRKTHIRAEIEAAKAGEKAEKIAAEVGYKEAIRRIDQEYADTIRLLDEHQREQARKLKANPRGRAVLYARNAARRRIG